MNEETKRAIITSYLDIMSKCFEDLEESIMSLDMESADYNITKANFNKYYLKAKKLVENENN